MRPWPLLEQTGSMFVLVRRVCDGTHQHHTLQRRIKAIRAEIEGRLEQAEMSTSQEQRGLRYVAQQALAEVLQLRRGVEVRPNIAPRPPWRPGLA